MPTPRTTRTTSTSILTTAAALAALSGCTSTPIAGTPLPAPTTTALTTTTPTTPPPAPSSTAAAAPKPTRDRAAALATARAWLAAYRGDRWTDTPISWVDRVRPLVTDRMHTANKDIQNAAVNHHWRTFVTGRCVSTVTDLDAVIPPEAPTTDTTLNVQVAGTVRTHCATSSPHATDKPAAATIVMTFTATGWLVDQRLY